MTATLRTRHLLARWKQIGGRMSVYEFDDGLEVEESDLYEIVCRRVFWEDVVLVTRHRERRVGLAVVAGAVGALNLGLGILAGRAAAGVWLAFGPIAAFALILFALVLGRPVEVLTVFGQRTRATLRFWRKLKEANRVQVRVLVAVQRAQEGLARVLTSGGVPAADAPASGTSTAG